MALFEWFEFKVPGKVICAEHCVDNIGLEMDKLGVSRALVVTDEGVDNAGLTPAVMEGMESGSAQIAGVFKDVPRNSEIKVVQACYEKARGLGADALISVGGGSVIDTAKATSILMVEGGELLDHRMAVYVPSGPMPPHIAVPTTAGTGSESTFAAVIADEEQKLKLVFQGPDLAPSVALLDPVMTKTLPPPLTASAGIGALTHCVEAIGSRMHQPICDGLALHAVNLISRHIRRAVEDGSDIEARTYMLVAANMGGIAFANAFAGMVHAMAGSCEGRFDVANSMASAVLLPYSMEFNITCEEQEMPARYRIVAEALGLDVRDYDDLSAARKGIEFIRNLIAEIGLPRKLRDVGIPEEGLEAVAEDSVLQSSMSNNPCECSYEETLELFKQAF